VPPLGEIGRDAVDIARGQFALSDAEWGWVFGTTGVLVGTAVTLDVPAYRHLSTRTLKDGLNTGRRVTASLARPGEWYDRAHTNRLVLGTVAGSRSGAHPPGPGTYAHLRADARGDRVHGADHWPREERAQPEAPVVGGEPAPFAFAPGTFSGEHIELALPSGHAARVFAVAAVLSEQAGRWYVSGHLYAGMASVGVERVRF
jgi:hypothetical protein